MFARYLPLLFLLACRVSGFPSEAEEASPVAKLNTIMGMWKDMMTTEEEIIMRSTPISETITTLLGEAKERIEEIRARVRCLQVNTQQAGIETTNDLLDVSKCSFNSAREVGLSVTKVVRDVETNILELAQIAAEFTIGLMKCAVQSNRSACASKIVSAAETSIARVACSIRTNLSKASDSLTTVTKEMTKCLTSGAQGVAKEQLELGRNIIKCITGEIPQNIY